MKTIHSHIKTLEDVRKEQVRVKERLDFYDKEFKKKFQQLPAELAIAGASNLIPKFLRGKVTDTALNGGRLLINKIFVSEDDKPNFGGNAKKTGGILPLVKTVFKMFKGR